jgi:hypothetical protein
MDEEDCRGQRQNESSKRANCQASQVPDKAKRQNTQVPDANVGVENRSQRGKEIKPGSPGNKGYHVIRERYQTEFSKPDEPGSA